jgi:hypothetical protein
VKSAPREPPRARISTLISLHRLGAMRLGVVCKGSQAQVRVRPPSKFPDHTITLRAYRELSRIRENRCGPISGPIEADLRSASKCTADPNRRVMKPVNPWGWRRITATTVPGGGSGSARPWSDGELNRTAPRAPPRFGAGRCRTVVNFQPALTK